jgi:hypothetical protein
MPLLIGGVADADERLVESKLLEWLQSSTASWHDNRMGYSWSAANVCLRKMVEDPATFTVGWRWP